MANENIITKESFEAAIDALLNAHSQNSNKGKQLKEWFDTSFSISATVSHVKEDKQIGNRVTEQFKHKLPIVVFVCDEEVNKDTLINKVRENSYKELNTILVMSSNVPHSYETLLSKEDNSFTEWAQLQLGLSVEQLESLSESAKKRERDFREYLVNVVGNKQENLDNSLAHLNRSFVKDVLRQYTGNPSIYETIDLDVLDLILKKVRKTPEDQSGNRNSSSRISRYINFLKYAMATHQQSSDLNMLPLQQIFYGAPGTGKSYMVNDISKQYSTIRTTFHPDSDYSTFVGSYKPTMIKIRKSIIIGQDEKEVKALNGNNYESKIQYSFVKQAFLKAYLGAWKKYTEANTNGVGDSFIKPQFLVIEEINRGNCAQIFGDLFQLLDRQEKNGFSCYPIEADADLQQEIENAFNNEKAYQLTNNIDVDGILDGYTSNYVHEDGTPCTLSEDIQSGRILLLPNNLYVWATMNTSDQSLFPIDSAFKRRWSWEYVRIAEGRNKDTHEPLRYSFNVKGIDYDWWSFIQEINMRVGSITSSEDKKLGYFFCSTEDGQITADKFVGKVCFYLWNDVFKDFGFGKRDQSAAFKKADGKDIAFDDFYEEDPVTFKTKVNESILAEFIKKLGVETVEQRKLREEQAQQPSAQQTE